MSNQSTRFEAGTGARFRLTGTVSNGATWSESYSFAVDGAAITDADLFTWQFNFRSSYAEGVVLSLSTTDSTLTITQGAAATALGIVVPYASLSALQGDYIADLVYQTVAGARVHFAHGIVTFRYEPLWSS